MKLWKTKKPISCVSGKSGTLKNEDKLDSNGGTSIQMAPMLSGKFFVFNEFVFSSLFFFALNRLNLSRFIKKKIYTVSMNSFF